MPQGPARAPMPVEGTAQGALRLDPACRGCSTSANSTSASWPKSNWPNSKLAEVEKWCLLCFFSFCFFLFSSLSFSLSSFFFHFLFAGASHDSPRTPNVHISGSRRFKHHQNSTKGPPREGRKKKSENLGGPAEECPKIQHPKIGRRRNWPKSKLAEVEIGRSRTGRTRKKSCPKSRLAEVDHAHPVGSSSSSSSSNRSSSSSSC